MSFEIDTKSISTFYLIGISPYHSVDTFEILNICVFFFFLCMCVESAKGSESRGASEEEDERAGVVAAAALPHHPLPHPQQTWKGDLIVPPSHFLRLCSCNALVSPLDGDM